MRVSPSPPQATTPVPFLPSQEATGLRRGPRDKEEPWERIPPSSPGSSRGLVLKVNIAVTFDLGRWKLLKLG